LVVEYNKFQLPLLLRNGNRYEVVVRGLISRQHQNVSTTDADCFDVLCKGSVQFRAGEGMSSSVLM